VESDPVGLRGGMNTYGYVGGNPVKWIDPYALAWQMAGGFGGQIIVPGLGFSLNIVGGLNVDGENSSFFIQGQANAGLGIGAFVGWGGMAGPSWGDDPKTGLDSTNYEEADAGWGPAASVSATRDKSGNVNGVSAAGPLKVGEGAGAGGFAGKQYTATYTSPTLKDLMNYLKSMMSSSKISDATSTSVRCAQ